jgi:hypothetical protein
MKKALFILSSLFVSALLVSACTAFSSKPSQNGSQTETSDSQQVEKSGDTTKSGKISKSGEKFYLQETGKSPIEINSYSIDINQYVGQTITVTGQYSGDTLYIGKVE